MSHARHTQILSLVARLLTPRQQQHPAAPVAQVQAPPRGEFLETNGLGGYVCGTLEGPHTSPFHGLVVVAKAPAAKRYVLLNGFDVRVVAGEDEVELGTSAGGLGRPAGKAALLRFEMRPWPSWQYDLGGGRQMEFECLARHGANQFVFCWQLTLSSGPVTLKVRPLLSGRPFESPRLADRQLDLRPRMPSSRLFVWSLRAGAPDLTLVCDGIYQFDPAWLTGFRYADPPAVEDLASPCEFEWHLQPRDKAQVVALADEDELDDPHTPDFVAGLADKIRKAERTRRRLFRSEIDRAADQYVVSGRSQSTVLSGYPHGGELGARAMMCVRGIALSPGRLDVASEILATWRGRMAAGLLPSLVSEHDRKPVFTSAAATLWYVIAAYEYIRASYRHGRILSAQERSELESSIREILHSLSTRRHRRIFMDEDGLLVEPDWEGRGLGRTNACTKRAHIQALWIAALRIGNRLHSAWTAAYSLARAEFERSFWNFRTGCFFQAIRTSSNGRTERVERFDPGQILAVGGLPISCVGEEKASLIVQALEQRLHGGRELRFPVPWQFGPFVEAWFRVHHRRPDVLEQVLGRFIGPWQRELRCGVRRGGDLADWADQDAGVFSRFAAVETMELLRILHLPELISGKDPFEDNLTEPLFYD